MPDLRCLICGHDRTKHKVIAPWWQDTIRQECWTTDCTCTKFTTSGPGRAGRRTGEGVAGDSAMTPGPDSPPEGGEEP